MNIADEVVFYVINFIVSAFVFVVALTNYLKLSRRIDWIEDRVEDLLLLQRKEMEK